ncbi:hypothetical protein ACK3TF_002829 [Chlorella vulgaris]
MSVARCLSLFRRHGPQKASAGGSPADTNSLLSHSAPPHSTPVSELAQLEKKELEDTEACYGRRGAVRCLGQRYAALLGRQTMARLRADLAVDSELAARFEELLKEDDADWSTWDAMTRWYDTKSYETVREPGQVRCPVGVPLHLFLKFNRAWARRCWDPKEPCSTDSDDEWYQ